MTLQTTFLKALQEVLKNDVAAVGLSIEDLFYIANDSCPVAERIRYGTYQKFIDSLDKYGEPTVHHDNAELLLQIQDCIKAKQASQKLVMLDSVMKGEKDWRRLVWLLQWQEKQERQKQAKGKQIAKEQKDREKAMEATEKLSASSTIDKPGAASIGAEQQGKRDINAMDYKRHEQLGKTG